MNLTIQLTPEDYIQATRLHMKPRPLLKGAGFLLLALIFLVLTAAFYLMIVHHEMNIVPFLLIACLIFLAVLVRYFIPSRCRKIFSQQKSMQIPYSWTVTDEGIFSKSELSDEKLPWNHFIRWKEGKNLFMLYHSDAMFRMIPKRCFNSPEEMTQFRQLVQTKLGPARI